MDLTHTLDDCLQRLASGQGRTEVLALYPEQADNLAPMLDAAIGWPRSPARTCQTHRNCGRGSCCAKRRPSAP